MEQKIPTTSLSSLSSAASTSSLGTPDLIRYTEHNINNYQSFGMDIRLKKLVTLESEFGQTYRPFYLRSSMPEMGPKMEDR
jgi:hypothetical protein